MPGAVTQGESEEQNVEMSLNVVAGDCLCYSIVVHSTDRKSRV